MSLLVAPERRIPLKQLSAAVTRSTRTWLLPSDSNIPIRAKFRTKPGPKIATLLWPAVVIPSSGTKGVGKPVQLLGGLARPFKVKPLSRSVIPGAPNLIRSEEHTSELQSRLHLVCRLLLEKKKKNRRHTQKLLEDAHRQFRFSDENSCRVESVSALRTGEWRFVIRVTCRFVASLYYRQYVD